MHVIVVRIYRVHLHPVGPEHSTIVEIGAAPGSNKRACFPLLDSGMPHVESDRRGVEGVLGAIHQKIAAMNEKPEAKGNDSSRNHACSGNTPEKAAACLSQN